MKKNLFYLLIIALGVTTCKSPEARPPVSRKSGSFINESVQRNRELVAYEESLILEVIERDTANKYLSSEGGFWYYYNKASTDTLNTRTPEYGDVVMFDYSIKTLDGEVIYGEQELPVQRYAIDKEELFTGLREGLKIMKQGETVTFIFPSHKAFGYYGDKNRIGTNVPVVTKVTLYSITKETNNNSDN